MGSVREQQAVFTALENIKETWQDLLSHPKVKDRDERLVATYLRDSDGELVKDSNGKDQPAGLWDPNNPVVALCNYIFQMENFVYVELNRSSRFKDETKISNLGAYGAAMFEIIKSA